LSSGGAKTATPPMLEMQSRLLAASAYGPAYVVAGVVLVVGVWVLVVALQLSRRQPGAGRRLGHAMLAFVVAELGTLTMALALQARMRPIMREMMETVARTDASMPAATTDVMGTVMRVMMVATIAWAVAWSGAKIVCCF